MTPVVIGCAASSRLESLRAIGERDQGVGIAPDRGQVKRAGDLPELRRAGDRVAIEPFFVVDPFGSLQLLGHGLQDLALRQLGAAGSQATVASST